MNKTLARDQEFFLPASKLFIALTVFIALLLNWLPWHGWMLAIRPDFVALILLYWCAHKPYRVSIGIAWGVGMIADVADASLFGQHALAYAVLAFGGTVLHRRIQMFDLRQQAMQIFPLLSVSYIVYALLQWKLNSFIAWSYFLGCMSTAALWIPLTLLMQNLRQPHSRPNDL